MRCGGTRSRVRYRLASPPCGLSSSSRLRIVTFGHTTSTVFRVAAVAPGNDFVEDAPRGQHAHDGGLAGAGCHLAGVTPEGTESARLGLRTRFVQRNLEPLQEVRTRLGQEDHRFSGFELGKEQPVLTPFAAPVAQQLHGGTTHATLAAQRQRPPFGKLGTDPVDQLESDGRSHSLLLSRRLVPGRAIEVHGGPAAGYSLRRLVFRDPPVLLRFFEWRIEDRLRDFVHVHGCTPNARQIASSFSLTSVRMNQIAFDLVAPPAHTLEPVPRERGVPDALIVRHRRPVPVPASRHGPVAARRSALGR